MISGSATLHVTDILRGETIEQRASTMHFDQHVVDHVGNSRACYLIMHECQSIYNLFKRMRNVFYKVHK